MGVDPRLLEVNCKKMSDEWQCYKLKKKTHTYTGSRTDQKLLWYSRARYRLYPLMGTGWYQKLCKLALVLAC